MTTAVAAELEQYHARVDSLFAEATRWTQAHGLTSERGQIDLNEEAYGEYAMDTLRLYASGGELIAELVPVGASIIGACGRVDLQGRIDQAILVYWQTEDAAPTSGAGQTADVVHRAPRYYRGIDRPGWYWVESQHLARAYRLDERLFFDLLLSVSDYDARQ